MADVELHQVEKWFGDALAVGPLDMVVNHGEILALVGPSGSGKTTTLHLVAGLEQPTTGEVRIGGRDMRDVPPRNRDVALVFQNAALFPHLTVFDNLAFGLRTRGTAAPEIRTAVDNIATSLQVTDCLQRKPAELSGGQCQRVAIGRAIVRTPAVSLFDEPLSQLDAPLRSVVRDTLLASLRRTATSAIYVTHDQAEALRVGDRVAIMDRGRIQQIDTPRRVYAAPVNRFVAQFIGSPPMNLLPGNVQRAAGRLRIECGQVLEPPESWEQRYPLPDQRPIELGFRPEDVMLGGAAAGCPGWEFAVVVVACVDLGAETLVEMTSADLRISFTARLAGGWSAPNGSAHRVWVPWERVHLFDRNNGRRLEPA